jgi:predicted CopG family antitoxin
MKNINMELTDELYYKLVELKGKFKADKWDELMALLVAKAEA